MKFSELAPRERHNFVYFLLFFFFYYFIMSAYFPFFPVWLADVNHLTKTETGIVFSSISLFAIIFQPVFGLMSDKLGLRKHLLWTITVLLILFAPFFIFVFSPLLQMNIIAGSLVGGIYLGIVFSSGSGAVEAYIERVSRANRFEYGKVRVAGCVGWALGANRQAFSLRTAAELLRMPRFWGFIVYVVGVASVYDVFDQQFANFFKSFFASPQRGTEVFGFVTTGGELLNALIMFCAPAIVNRIGAKNALLTAGMIMSVRILGSSFASSAVEVVILKMLHMFENPFLLVGTFKYISSAFNPRLSATLFLIGFNLSKQLSGVVLSAWVGRMYDTVGFHQAYLILGCITLSFTLLSFVTLRGGNRLLPTAETQSPA
ncbi:TPA: oligosaccharide MFS transporter [Klebsiella pneumoniae]|nr:oligosaccharide MFS transporter [Klebsiella pneumoniae]